MSEQNLIDPQAIGVEVSWSFGDGDAQAVQIGRDLVVEAFNACGFDGGLFVPAPTPDEAIRRAFRYRPQHKDRVVKEFARPNKDTPRAYGIYERVARDGEAGDGWECGARVRVESDQIVCLEPEDGAFIAECKGVGDTMVHVANGALHNAYNIDLSHGLVAAGGWSGWISRRRNAGGVYFIPLSTAESFVKLLRALAKLTEYHPRDFQFIPQIQEVYPKPLTMESWRGSAQDNFEADVTALVGELERMLKDGVMRDKTKEARAEECDALIGKAERYRVFLGDAVDQLATRLTSIRGVFEKAIGDNLEAAQQAFDEVGDLTPARPKRPRQQAQEAEPTSGRPMPRSRKPAQMSVNELFDV